MKHLRTCAILFGAAVSARAGTAAADPVTFAQVSEGDTGDGVAWTNNGAGAATLNTAMPGGDLVSLSFDNVGGLSSALSGPLAAIETINGGAGATTTAVTRSAFGYDLQAINAPITISYELVMPIDGLSNLLTITITPDHAGGTGMVFAGQEGGSGATSSTSQPGGQTYTMSFSSSFLNFTLSDPISADFSYSSLAPGMSIGADGLLNGFTAEDTGTFSAAASPALVGEPASFAVFTAGVLGLCAMRKGRVFAF